MCDSQNGKMTFHLINDTIKKIAPNSKLLCRMILISLRLAGTWPAAGLHVFLVFFIFRFECVWMCVRSRDRKACTRTQRTHFDGCRNIKSIKKERWKVFRLFIIIIITEMCDNWPCESSRMHARTYEKMFTSMDPQNLKRTPQRKMRSNTKKYKMK